MARAFGLDHVRLAELLDEIGARWNLEHRAVDLAQDRAQGAQFERFLGAAGELAAAHEALDDDHKAAIDEALFEVSQDGPSLAHICANLAALHHARIGVPEDAATKRDAAAARLIAELAEVWHALTGETAKAMPRFVEDGHRVTTPNRGGLFVKQAGELIFESAGLSGKVITPDQIRRHTD